MDEQNNSNKLKQELNEEALKNFTTSATSSSWTILPADRIENLDNTSGSDESSSSIETKASREQEQEQESSNEPAKEYCKPVEDSDPQAEDFSDGISIISDCESTGRLTPNPLFRGLLNDMNANFDLHPELPTTPLNRCGIQQLRTRRRHDMEQLEDVQDGQEKSTMTRPNTELSEQPSIVGFRLPILVQNGLTAIFYVGATLAILSFIGRLKNPEWQVNNPPSADLEQRLVDLEMQNNLMRAEIDIMSKQINYLSGQGQSQQQSQAQGRKPKTFKAWPGNGNSVDPVDITKQDLKRPYKCPDGTFVEIAGMCMESMKKPHAESLVDEIGNVVNDVLQQSQTFQSFEKITEKLGTLAGNDNGEQVSEQSTTFHAHGDKDNRQGHVNYKQRPDSSKERYQSKYSHDKCQAHHSNSGYKCNENDFKEPIRSKSNEDDSNEHSKKRTRSKSNEDDSNEHSKERTRSKSNENDSNEHSKEHTHFKSNEYNSKERYQKKFADRAKERYGKKQQQNREHNSDERGSGEWHEKMMQQRENARQRHDQKRNNNWYIERGGSREQKRSGETRR